MRVLVGNSLQDGFLDYAGGQGLVEIVVTRMITVRRVSGEVCLMAIRRRKNEVLVLGLTPIST